MRGPIRIHANPGRGGPDAVRMDRLHLKRPGAYEPSSRTCVRAHATSGPTDYAERLRPGPRSAVALALLARCLGLGSALSQTHGASLGGACRCQQVARGRHAAGVAKN